MSGSLHELIDSVHSAESVQRVNAVLESEVSFLKKAIFEPNMRERKLRDLMLRVAYCHMLGQESEYAFMKCIELATKTDSIGKKTGYLVASLIIPPDHDFSVMIVNQMNIDSRSSNILEISFSLAALTKLAREDVIPMLLNTCLKHMTHPHQLVRKMSLCALLRFVQLNPECLVDCQGQVVKLLEDRDPSVVSVALDLVYGFVKRDPVPHKGLVEPLCKLLVQIMEGKLGPDHVYHTVPAPWIQMKILQVLSLLGAADQTASAQIYPTLAMFLNVSQGPLIIHEALVCECLRTITSIYPNTTLLEKAAGLIGFFLKSKDNSILYLGIQGLIHIVKVNPKYTIKHQMKVLECLESKDESLRSKAMNLLAKMCNPSNMQVISEKMIDYMRTTSDEFSREKTVDTLFALCEQFTPSPFWFMKTMTTTFELAHSYVKPTVLAGVISLLKDGSGDADQDAKLRSGTVELYIQLLKAPALPECVIQLQAWILGEFASKECSCGLKQVVDGLCVLLGKGFSDETILAILQSLTKLVLRMGFVTDGVTAKFNQYLKSRNAVLQQEALQFFTITQNMLPYVDHFQVGVNSAVLKVNMKSGVIANFVQSSLMQGKKAYSLPDIYKEEQMIAEE